MAYENGRYYGEAKLNKAAREKFEAQAEEKDEEKNASGKTVQEASAHPSVAGPTIAQTQKKA